MFAKRRFRNVIVMSAAIATVATPVAGQPTPNSSLWTTIYNPSGQQVVPVVFYDPVTGVLGLDTRGLNRIDDTPDYTTIGGPIQQDDVGVRGILVETNVSNGHFQPPFNGPDLMQRIS